MFSGSMVAIVTPMDDEGAIDFNAFTRLLDWHIENGTDGIVLLGTTGESPTVIMNERIRLIDQAVKVIDERIPLVVGTGTNSTTSTIELTQQAMELGADAALVVTPYYNKPTQEGLVAHFRAVASTVPLPQILYNVPSRTGCDLLPESVKELASVANIVAIKEATGDVSRVEALKGLEIDLLSGDDKTALAFLSAGGKGVISVVANVVPQLFHQLVEAVNAGNAALAQRIDVTLQPLYEALSIESNPIPVKWAVAHMGLIDYPIRLPLTLLSKEHQPKLVEALQAVSSSARSLGNVH